jgi:hypothetical protein
VHTKLTGTNADVRDVVHDGVNEVVAELVQLVVLVLKLIPSPV